MKTISLEARCLPECESLVTATRAWVGGYSRGAAIRDITAHPTEGHGTFRKRANAAIRRGYYVLPVEPKDFADDIREVNRSLPERQGRPMDSAYWDYEPATTAMPPILCERHHYRFLGVFAPGGKLVAYASVVRCGELVVISQILGHGFYMKDGIMFLLALAIMDEEEDGVLFYNRWDSGTDGLRWFKERIGMERADVAWTA